MRRGKNQKNRVIDVLEQKRFAAEVHGSQLELAEIKAPIMRPDTCSNVHNAALTLNLL